LYVSIAYYKRTIPGGTTTSMRNNEN